MLTTDGAPVMQGCNNVVQVLLKEYTCHLIEYHSIAYNEALAVSHAYKSIVYLESIL